MTAERLPARLFLSILLLAPLTGCGSGDDAPHAHGADDAPHAHGIAVEDRPTVAVSRWTTRTELFMEYPLLVAGVSGRAAIHVTDLSDFSPLVEGESIVTLRSADGRVFEFRGGPSRPGIFGVDLLADQPGVYSMTLRIDAPSVQDVHELGDVIVHRADQIPAGPGDEEEGGISFLKEQQWTLEFGTTPAEMRDLRSSVTVPATIRARSGGDATLTAPVPGRIDPSFGIPVPGSRVRVGAVLARIAPRSDDLRDAAALRAALVEAEQQHALATREVERLERLVEARAIPARRLDEARAGLVGSEARLGAARERWSRYESLSQSGEAGAATGGFAVRAPFGGVVSEVRFARGESVQENQVLVRLIDTAQVHVVGALPESDSADLDAIRGGELLLKGGEPVTLPRPISIGRVVEPVARTTEVRFAFDNRSAHLPIGRSATLRLFLGIAESGTAIPESAIVSDDGRPVAFVQTGGETFERRPLRLGSRAGGWVHVTGGIEPGERVVHRGAYLVRLASMSSQVPAHGHVH